MLNMLKEAQLRLRSLFEGFEENLEAEDITPVMAVNDAVLKPDRTPMADVLDPDFDIKSWMFVPIGTYLRYVGFDDVQERILQNISIPEEDLFILRPEVAERIHRLFRQRDIANPLSPAEEQFRERIDPYFRVPHTNDNTEKKAWENICAKHSAAMMRGASEQMPFSYIKPLSLDMTPFVFEQRHRDFNANLNNPYPSSLDFNHAIRNADFNAPFWQYVFFHEVAHLHPENRQVKDQTECEFDADRRALEIYADLFPDGPDIRPLVLAFRAASSYADNPDYAIALQLDAYLRGDEICSSEQAIDIEQRFDGTSLRINAEGDAGAMVQRRLELMRWGRSITNGHVDLSDAQIPGFHH